MALLKYVLTVFHVLPCLCSCACVLVREYAQQNNALASIGGVNYFFLQKKSYSEKQSFGSGRM